MKKLLTLIALAGSLTVALAQNAPAPAKPTEPAAPSAQQNRMKSCNADPKAKELKGDDRKAFMKSCLSGDTASATPQQNKMKSCNADPKAKTLKGDERKAFMKECLSG